MTTATSSTGLPAKPDFTDAYTMVKEVYNGAASQERARIIKNTLEMAEQYIKAVIEREERAVSPQVLVEYNHIFMALKQAGIEGSIAMLITPPAKDTLGKYSVTTQFGKHIGEAAQLAKTILLIGKGMEAFSTEAPAEGE